MKNLILNELSTIPRRGIVDLLEYLRTSDFFTAPASTKHHLSEPGGLAKHSWNVYQALARIHQENNLDIPHESVKICGLLHDVCKIGVYKREMKRVRSASGSWSDEEVWAFKDPMPLGHGEKSVIIIMRFMDLTDDEQLAIRWHMGKWDAEGYSATRSLSEAMDKSMLLKALMLADQMATYMKEGKDVR